MQSASKNKRHKPCCCWEISERGLLCLYVKIPVSYSSAGVKIHSQSTHPVRGPCWVHLLRLHPSRPRRPSAYRHQSCHQNPPLVHSVHSSARQITLSFFLRLLEGGEFSTVIASVRLWWWLNVDMTLEEVETFSDLWLIEAFMEMVIDLMNILSTPKRCSYLVWLTTINIEQSRWVLSKDLKTTYFFPNFDWSFLHFFFKYRKSSKER